MAQCNAINKHRIGEEKVINLSIADPKGYRAMGRLQYKWRRGEKWQIELKTYVMVQRRGGLRKCDSL